MLLKDNVKLNLVYEDDKVEYLKKIGLYEKIIDGKMFCRMCNKLITLDNLGKVYKSNGQLYTVCSDLFCMTRDYRK